MTETCIGMKKNLQNTPGIAVYGTRVSAVSTTETS